MSFVADLEAWWNRLTADSKPAFEQVKASLEAEVNLIKADVTNAVATARNDLTAQIEQHAPEIKAVAAEMIDRMEKAVLAVLEKH